MANKSKNKFFPNKGARLIYQIDGGQWQMPMPHLITEGIITNGNKLPMYVLAQLNTQGNGIAIADLVVDCFS